MIKITLIFVSLLTLCLSAELQTVTDDELLNLIQTEKYVVSLFSRRDSDSCNNFEKELIGAREDLVETLGAWVVKTIDSQMTRLYSPTKEPALVFFRHGVPLLYDGPVNEELILHTFTANKEPTVKELTDETFEHLTQASTGATTGDWFVMFYSNDCVDCQRLQARWESVGAQLKTRMNVARVNKGSAGANTARRFDVFHVPAFILFRQGKMYRYEIHKYDVASFTSFAQDWYKNAVSERIPHPKTPFDNLVAIVTEYLQYNPWLIKVGLGSIVIGFVMSIFLKIKAASTKAETEKPKKKK